MRVLVTGGSGFIGGAVVERLVERGDQVRSLARRPSRSLLERGVEAFVGDIADAGAVRTAVEGVDAVIHVAAKAGYWGSLDSYYLPNVIGTRNVIDACREAGVERLVYTSTPSVIHGGGDVAGADETVPYPETFASPYPATKAEAERMVLEANDASLATVALRPHLVWGPGDNQLVPRLVQRAKQNRLRLVGDGTNLVDTTFVDNAALAHVLALDRLAVGAPTGGRAYFIAQGEPLPLATVVRRLLEASGAPPPGKHVSEPAAMRLAGLIETVWRVGRFGGEPPLTRFLVEQLATDHWYDLTAATRDLGYVPEVTFDEGVTLLARAHAAGSRG